MIARDTRMLMLYRMLLDTLSSSGFNPNSNTNGYHAESLPTVGPAYTRHRINVGLTLKALKYFV